MTQRHEYEIVEIKEESPSTFTIVMQRVDGEKTTFLPGQFHMVYVFGYGQCALSFSGDSKQQHITHTVRKVGCVTEALSRMHAGDRLLASGPYGTGWPLEEEGEDIVLIAGGVGIAPLLPVLYHIAAHRERFGKVTVLYGAKEPSEILYQKEWPLFEKEGIQLHISVDRADTSWLGHVGVIPSLIKKVEGINANTKVFLCGPEVMLKFAVHELRKQEVSEENIFLSLERHMDCGEGLCGRCQLGPYLLCREGPILRLCDLAPYLYIKEL